MQKFLALAVLLAFAGCDDGDSSVPLTVVDARVQVDIGDGFVGTVDMSGSGGSGGSGGVIADMGDVDSAIGGSPDSGMVDMGDMGLGGMGGADMAMLPPGAEAPTYAQVATAVRGEVVYLVWAEGETIKQRTIDREGDFQGETLVVVEQGAEWIAALTVAGIPWVAYGSENENIRVYKADEPEADAIELNLKGQPLLASLGDSVMIIGATDAGDLAWALLTGEADEEAPQSIVDSSGLPFPNSAAGVVGGAILRFDKAGQCVLVSDVTQESIGNFPCGSGTGRVISNGEQAMIMTLATNGLVVAIHPAHDADETFRLGNAALAELLQFPPDGQRWVVGLESTQQDRQGRIEVLAAGIEGLWRSAESWAGWPFANARALVNLGETSLALVFGYEDGPRAVRIPMEAVDFNGDPFRFDLPEACVPTVEVCDLVDQNCDGEIDDGLCCEYPRLATSHNFNGVGQMVPMQPLQMLFSDTEFANEYRMVVRMDEDTWVAKRMTRNGQGVWGEVQNLDGQELFEHAHEAKALVAAGGFTALVARNDDGEWAISWHYRSAEVRPHKIGEVLGCDEILDVDVADHTSDNILQNASVLIVCSDKVIRAYPETGGDWGPEGRPNVVLPLDLDDVRWARISRLGGDLAQIMVGYISSLGTPQVRSFTLASGGRAFMQYMLPNGMLSEEDGLAEINDAVFAPDGRKPYLQIRDIEGVLSARAFVRRSNVLHEWVDLVASQNADHIEYAQAKQDVVFSAPIGDAENPETGFWVVHLGETAALNLWSTEPVFTWPGEAPQWTVSRGNYADYILLYQPTPDRPDNPELIRLVTRRVSCIAP